MCQNSGLDIFTNKISLKLILVIKLTKLQKKKKKS